MNYRVEIMELGELSARVRVSDLAEDCRVEFSCGAGNPAHAALRHMVHNAFRELAQARANKMMRDFAGGN